ncbi:ABC transporter ATP-binding protein [Brevibacillus centrosporus]|uniref:Peptide/nickel transport system ATP-binding protein n=1 Tax=Brevibacillus centrosporus TaxID=54910 RepID=A0A1I3ZVL7_9BACL|nr:ABC transporter ATP-binding protein [Brevibacillus centrosporus]MEC2131798.1 ABC transporter ATP-binding protein [Brevibacillus centrosporus]MED4908508.1 ABC transporter ATP-binding protein [Brevibacillus centrosporus]RNB67438.1 ABC transporter ATP-binding protein [Brevibacillus centrosporus]SFK47977.1 peptide/nickel transport system ATP-binding protein [Brevibacillus centrosporus]GED33620.1 ABC transporter ATP-binding protein [Brevibacillus centrosporus]
MERKLLEIKGLKTYFYTDEGVVAAVDGVDISIRAGETVGIVGESGSGKSVTSLTAMRLTPGKVVEGSITFDGKEILGLSEEEMREIRGNEMAMIFQEPMTSLNPVFTIGDQIGEAVRIHRNYSKAQARARAVEMLKLVGIPRAEQIVDEYPHRLSGGMRQRVMIAMAMACDPKLLIADEPTTALDVTIQAQILDLMSELKASKGTAILLITHDLGVVAEMCDRVVVMYDGRVVEESDVVTLFTHPRHPYTQGLMKSMPTLDSEEKRLYSIKGSVPAQGSLRIGCSFAPRCEHAMAICREQSPPLQEIELGHFSRCFLHASAEGRTGHEPAVH